MSEAAEATHREFFIYQQADGTAAVADSLANVPGYARDSVRVVTLPVPEEKEAPLLDPGLLEGILKTPKDTVDSVVQRAHEQPLATGSLDPTSVLLGGAVGFAVALLFGRVLKAPKWLIRIGLVLLVGCLGSGIFYGWVRQRVGLGHGETVVHPGDLVEDAREAAKAVERHYKEQERRLNELEEKLDELE